ncbi:hypothetical protein V8C26DRAFT_414357 [Trichoderma gracile]
MSLSRDLLEWYGINKRSVTQKASFCEEHVHSYVSTYLMRTHPAHVRLLFFAKPAYNAKLEMRKQKPKYYENNHLPCIRAKGKRENLANHDKALLLLLHCSMASPSAALPAAESSPHRPSSLNSAAHSVTICFWSGMTSSSPAFLMAGLAAAAAAAPATADSTGRTGASTQPWMRPSRQSVTTVMAAALMLGTPPRPSLPRLRATWTRKSVVMSPLEALGSRAGMS